MNRRRLGAGRQLRHKPGRHNGSFDFLPAGSRTIAPAPAGAVVEHMSGEPAEIVLQLEARGISHIYVDGGITVQRFLRAGLLQKLIITRVPVLIGTGIPLFGVIPQDIHLQHVATREYAGGLVKSEYAVTAQRDGCAKQ